MTSLHRRAGLVAVFIAACATIPSCSDDDPTPAPTSDAGGNDVDASANGDGGSTDGSGPDADARVVRCNPASAFGAPVHVEALSSPALDFTPSLSEGELVATLVSNRAPDAGAVFDVLAAMRTDVDAPWSTPAVVTAFSGERNGAVAVSADGLTMFLERGAPPRLWIARRTSTATPWTAPQTWVESADDDTMPFLVADGSAVYFLRQGKIHRSARTGAGTYAAPSAITWVSDPREPIRPVVTGDELTLYIGDRPAGGGPFDVYVARRADANAPWGTAALVTELSSAVADWPSWISADDCVLYFTSNRTLDDAGTPDHDVWMAKR